MPTLFYSHFWHLINYEVVTSVKNFFKTGYLLKEMNQTNIVLIPKCEGANQIKQFRPIFLCNVSYKIISKIIANRLQPLLQKIISPYQAAFLKGRFIHDNSIIAHEILHSMRYRKRGKVGWLAMKCDMEKAFDKVEWKFLLCILKNLGFSSKACQLIEQCIFTMSYQIMINGTPYRGDLPSRGLGKETLSLPTYSSCALKHLQEYYKGPIWTRS